MAIIFEIPSDPTDLVMQGQTIGDEPKGWVPDNPVALSGATATMMQGGEDWIAEPLPYPTTPPVIGWMPYYASPSIGWPMANCATGEILQVPIGPGVGKMVAPAALVDPVQTFLASTLALDLTGMYCPMDLLPIDADQSAPPVDLSQGPENAWDGLAAIQVPRVAIQMSGYGTHRNPMTAPVLPDQYGLIKGDWYVESSVEWFVSGVTKDAAGNPLGSCRVVVLATDKVMSNPDVYANPVIGETVSDAATGAFAIQVSDRGPVQVVAYKAGSPDVMGVTVNTVRAVPRA